MSTLTHEVDAAVVLGPVTFEVRVQASRREAESVTSFELTLPDGGLLPPWNPGAHIDVHLPSGTVRQYSLCGDPADRSRYRIAVLELPEGRGGSLEAHRELRPGRTITIGSPRENFSLAEAERYVFVAGGIGITPLLPMIHEVQRRGTPWKLIYGARSSEHFAFVGELTSLHAPSIELYAQDTDGRPDLEGIVRSSGGALVYSCGPAGLMDALSEHMERAGRRHELHIERFAPAIDAPRPGTAGAAGGGPAVAGAAVSAQGAGAPGNAAFEVQLERSGTVVSVGPNETVLEAVRTAGVNHPSSCEMGFCGTCEVKVLCGDIDHRDELLSESERAQGTSMMICVSRARSPRLVLDL
jgi:ferredoxin-NADP reductase